MTNMQNSDREIFRTEEPAANIQIYVNAVEVSSHQVAHVFCVLTFDYQIEGGTKHQKGKQIQYQKGCTLVVTMYACVFAKAIQLQASMYRVNGK